ncbi:hypothetical protein [Shewanella fidelis]|uniref:DUF4157 domain-containing protein n=1 Tax=Shewanella fidelis TaxID=173509 RepID=A0AAW8NQV4_9GAMM|nr:hypothetical protein [Shewanella fidelis]MDR8525563.1 hypothetical protein [Shewanella fidelis]MDW4813118.1 hypothetical protein [Shewanella fidelis]MDW4817002.1 hypothetical protein [Shewanella fidelis]MDW4820161.1 hypothetical protein [Shewanella fidelis]MDW4825583.1 hypothetical protein [Shewanella fidelis]
MKARGSVLIYGMLLCLSISVSTSAWAAEAISFLTKTEAAAVLTQEDEFVRGISSFDMASRMKRADLPSKSEYLAFVATQTLDWTDADKAAVNQAYQQILPQLTALKVELPKPIELIKTTGLEEGGAAYTRGQAIILQQKQLNNAKGLPGLIAHELLHIYSRHNPEVKQKLYQAIGFYPLGEISFPTALSSQKITNPDAPINDFGIRVNYQGKAVWAVPILYSEAQYNLEKGGEFFDYLEFKFVIVGDSEQASTNIYDADKPQIVKVSELKGFFKQIGRNTNYIIHPEEIIAENFSFLMTGETELKSPHVLHKIEQVFLSQ